MSVNNSREAFGLTILSSRHTEIRKLRKQQGVAELHGNKLWKSSLVLMDYLREAPLTKGARVLELGCGWGLGGIYCAKSFAADVVCLDADEGVLPFAELHAQINDTRIQTYCATFESLTAEQLSGFDAVIGADICFWDEMTGVLSDLLVRAVEAEVPRIVLTDPGRQPFRHLAEAFSEEIEGAMYTDWDVPEPHNLWGLVLDL